MRRRRYGSIFFLRRQEAERAFLRTCGTIVFFKEKFDRAFFQGRADLMCIALRWLRLHAHIFFLLLILERMEETKAIRAQHTCTYLSSCQFNSDSDSTMLAPCYECLRDMKSEK